MSTRNATGCCSQTMILTSTLVWFSIQLYFCLHSVLLMNPLVFPRVASHALGCLCRGRASREGSRHGKLQICAVQCSIPSEFRRGASLRDRLAGRGHERLRALPRIRSGLYSFFGPLVCSRYIFACVAQGALEWIIMSRLRDGKTPVSIAPFNFTCVDAIWISKEENQKMVPPELLKYYPKPPGISDWRWVRSACLCRVSRGSCECMYITVLSVGVRGAHWWMELRLRLRECPHRARVQVEELWVLEGRVVGVEGIAISFNL
jgi:hypothetical protein